MAPLVTQTKLCYLNNVVCCVYDSNIKSTSASKLFCSSYFLIKTTHYNECTSGVQREKNEYHPCPLVTSHDGPNPLPKCVQIRKGFYCKF